MPLFAKTIRELVLTGNTKTQKKAVLRWGDITLGKPITDEQLKRSMEKLKRAYQFNIKRMEFKNDILFMDIEDKWSIFPIPMITQSGGYYSRGILLYENNFLGRLGTIATGVFLTNTGLNGLLYWQEDNVIRQNIGMKIILLHKSDLNKVERNDKIVKSFETRIDSIILHSQLFLRSS